MLNRSSNRLKTDQVKCKKTEENNGTEVEAKSDYINVEVN